MSILIFVVYRAQPQNEANLTTEELELQHKKRDWIYIQKSSIELATQQGLQQGLEQGEWNAHVKMIINANQLGLPLQTISALTSLSEAQIRLVLEQNKDEKE